MTGRPFTPALARSTLDRAADRRRDERWLADAWADARTRVLLLDHGDPQRHGRRNPGGIPVRFLVTASTPTPELVFCSPEQVPEGERYLLGEDSDGTVYFAVRLKPGKELPAAPGTQPVSLRRVGALLNARDAGLATHAAALAHWHAEHGFCPRCGSPTRIESAGHVRVCDNDGSEHFPRIDPAVIMLVHRETDAGEQCLLAHNPAWPEGRYSVLAGFVEPGESLEHAVVREVAEEVGILVTDPVYLGSQPWPFPRSLMVGYLARAVGSAPRTDHEEIADIRWLTRHELGEAVTRGEILLPGPVSIAHQLIEHWYGQPLPPGRWASR